MQVQKFVLCTFVKCFSASPYHIIIFIILTDISFNFLYLLK